MLTIEQKKDRLSGIGGSDAAAILGISKWKTPLDIYLMKTGQLEIEDDDPEDPNYNDRLIGSKVEPYLRRFYAEKTGFNVEVPDKMFRCETNPFMIANIDGIVRSENIVVEFKKAFNFLMYMKKLWGKEGTDQIPAIYNIQGSHYSCVYRPKRVDVVVSFLDDTAQKVILNTDDTAVIEFLIKMNFKIYHYFPHERLERNLIEAMRQFWEENVKKLMPPLPKNFKDAGILWPGEEESVLVANSKHYEIIDSIKEVQEKIKVLENEETKRKLNLIEAMRGHSKLVDNSNNKKRLATWRKERRESLPKTPIKERYPDIYKEFAKTSESDVLRLA